MPYLDPFANRQFMQKWMVLPNAPEDVLASFINPFIITDIRRGEDQCAVFWYSGEYLEGVFRKRADAWEAEQWRKQSLPKGREST
jgi:hypothetical protein